MRLRGPDRLAIAALALANVGVGVRLVGHPDAGAVHVAAGTVALLLALPAILAAGQGRLPALADTGVLINVGVMVFLVLDVALLPGPLAQRLGLALLVAAVALATGGLYLRLFGERRRRARRGAR